MSVPQMTSSEAVAPLPRTRVSDLKTHGWRSVMTGVQRDGAVVITNQNRPEAVILTIAEYEKFADAKRRESERQHQALNDLRAEYDAQLEVLQSADAAETLMGLMRKPTTRGGKKFTGAEF